MNSQFKYDVAFSFAGEDREYVERVASILHRRQINVFYDKYEQANMWGKDLYVHLDEVYRKQARYCVVFISKHYKEKLWTNHERKSAQARAFESREEYILPARFDDTELPGVTPTTGYIDLRRISPEELAELILKKLGSRGQRPALESTTDFRRPKASASDVNPYEKVPELIDYVSKEIVRRGDSIVSRGFAVSAFNRGDRSCIRVVERGNTRFSLDMWMGGIGGDDSINLHGIRGKPTYSDGASNAWGHVLWDREKEDVVLELHNLSLLDRMHDPARFTFAGFADALWEHICDILEED